MDFSTANPAIRAEVSMANGASNALASSAKPCLKSTSIKYKNMPTKYAMPNHLKNPNAEKLKNRFLSTLTD
jgi:hypothetical protein